MKKILIVFIFLLSQRVLQAQDIAIPDANFKAALLSLGVDTNTDTKIQVSEAEAVHYLDVSGKHIADVSGLEYFINLDTLLLNQNQLTSLDVTENVKLITLMFAYNHIETIDLSQNTKLKYLLSAYSSLTTLDISNCKELKELYCHMSHLTALDVSANTNLIKLDCQETDISSLDLSNNKKLTMLHCQQIQISSLDLTNNTVLIELNCQDLKLSALDLTHNTALQSVNCINNEKLTQICITTAQLALTSTPYWQKDADATWNTNCTLTTALQDAATATTNKTVYKIYTTTGAEINEANARDGIYIYLYTDGSRTKIVK